MNTKIKTRRWTLLAKPQRGEHSLWRKEGDPKGVVYVADDSGSNPDRTDDGPLMLVGDLMLRKGGSMSIVADVRVWSEDTEPRGYTGLHPVVALWLVENEGFKTVIKDDDLRIVGKLLGVPQT